MKNFLKFSAVAVALVASATFASADTINLASSSSTVNYIGYSTSSGTVYDPSYLGTGGNVYNVPNPTPSTGTGTAAYNVTPPVGGAWLPALPGSSWVSSNPNAYPGGSVAPANGYYTFSTTFSSTTAGYFYGTIDLMADDTVAVYLNGVLVVPASNIGADWECSANTPTCTTVGTFSIGGDLVLGDNNTLTFVVEQTDGSAEGLDYTASLTNVPEPNTLMLLGTGLLGSAGALFRRMRS